MPRSPSEQRPTRSRHKRSFEYWGGQNGKPPDQIEVSENLQRITPVPSIMEESDTPEPTSDA